MSRKFNSERTFLSESDPNISKSVRKVKFIAQGGFSKVFQGEMGTEKTLVAIKIMKKEPFVPWRKAIGRVVDSASSHLMSIRNALGRKRQPEAQVIVDSTESSSEEESVVKTKVPNSLSRAEIKVEIDSLRRFQESTFVIKLLGVSNSRSTVWVITEFCVGNIVSILEEMFQVQKMKKNEKQGLVVHLLAPILSALLFIHEKGYIHRDIKPSNIVLNQLGIPKLIDFGLCVQLSPESGTYKSKHMSGSPYFMSPEAVKNDPVSTKSDAFSFAATAVNLRTLLEPKAIYSYEWYRWEYIVLMFQQSKEKDEELSNIMIQHQDPSKKEDLSTRCKEDYQTLKEYVVNFAEGTVKDCYNSFSPYESWGRVKKDIGRLIAIDVDQRGTLQDLEDNEFFKQEMIDWKKYPCDHSELSRYFVRLQGFIETFLKGDE